MLLERMIEKKYFLAAFLINLSTVCLVSFGKWDESGGVIHMIWRTIRGQKMHHQ